jgi:hypothetical protein
VALFVIDKGNDEDIGKVFPLLPNTAIIGRKTGDSNPDIYLNDVRVSREHADVTYQQGCYYLRDLGSKNGTEIDGERLQPGELYPLKHNSVIGLGITAEGPCILLRFSGSDETVPISAMEKERPKASLVEWLKIDEEKKEVWVDGKPIHLSRKEYSLMLFLHHYAGKICSKDDIIAVVWPQVQEPGVISDANVDQLIHRLREKVEANPASPTRIVSKKGFGYMLI